jgi:DNA-binding response OmpR family regulator
VAESIHVLFIEDDQRLATLTAEYLRMHSMVVTHLPSANHLRPVLTQLNPSVIVLDMMLPGIDGLAACRAVREFSDIPILFVTARGDEIDRIVGLELGADDYISKPFSAPELAARIRAAARRHRGAPAMPPVLHAGRLEMHPAERTAFLDKLPLQVTTSEFNLLMVFANNQGRVLSREQLFRRASNNPDWQVDRGVDVQISRLRQKLRGDGSRPDPIRTVRGVGYLFTGD